MLTVLAASFPVFALIALGAVFGRWRRVGAEGIRVLNSFTASLALPVLLFLSLARADWAHLAQPGFLVAYVGSTVIAFGIALAFCLPRGAAFADRVLAALAAGYSNTAFIGIPLLTALLGPIGTDAAVIATIATVSALFAVAILLVEASLHRGHGIEALRRTAIGVARSPLVIAPIAGAVWNVAGLSLPHALARMLDLLGAAASPCALVTIGAFIALPGTTAPRRPLGFTLAIKLVIQPLIALLLLEALRLGGHPAPRAWAQAALLLAALPTGTGPFMLAELYGREAALASRSILLSTVIGAATVSVIAALLLT